MSKKRAIIIGAGPAGLTAAYELLAKTDILPIIYEESDAIGGISKTVDYKGNKIDIGGHRFFSKSDRVTNWWKNILPIQTEPAKDDIILNRSIPVQDNDCSVDPENTDKAMLLRHRVSRILFLGKFFSYPVSINKDTIANLGLQRVFKMGVSYLKTMLTPMKKEESLEDFFKNRFGDELYRTFFKDYTEKVWGVSCSDISAEWGAQRVKGLSVSKAVLHFLKKTFMGEFGDQKKVETSLIEQFMYPKFGPGQLWEEVAAKILENGGQIYLNHKVVGVNTDDKGITSVDVRNSDANTTFTVGGEYFFSTMPVKDLINAMQDRPPKNVKEVANGLLYRDFMTVGLLLNKMKLENQTEIKTINNIIPDNWIYVQETAVKMGRIQVFNNWSPYLVRDLDKIWLGLEYFCNEGDNLWNQDDEAFKELAIQEMVDINIIDRDDVLDATVIRCKKAYPAYFGAYERFDEIRQYLCGLENLFPIGRNGMHRYNNMDHSMLTAITAVDNIVNGVTSKDNIWNVNAEKEYHEK